MPPSLSDLSMAPALRRLGRILNGFDPRSWEVESPTEALAIGFHSLRSSLFFTESLPLFWLQRPTLDSKSAPPSAEAVGVLVTRLRELLARDAKRIGRGVAPLSVLAPRDPLGHPTRLLRILADGLTISLRRRKRAANEFGTDAARWLDDLPAYYRRNFHFQTDGYLSERSADLYEHQVELLFRGGADAMRRMVLAPLKTHFGDHNGRGLRFLELGSGTGSATRAVASAFPKAKITCLDLSYPYTRYAQKQLAEFDRVECVQGDASDLEFADARFDAVYSVFLFHELPLPVRELALEQARRVLRPDGLFALVDSLQTGDDEGLDWALEFFPRAFHEPYYAHYASHPMEDLVREAGFDAIGAETGYLAKCVWARPTSAPRGYSVGSSTE